MNESQFKSYSETLNAPQHHHLKNNPKGWYQEFYTTLYCRLYCGNFIRITNKMLFQFKYCMI